MSHIGERIRQLRKLMKWNQKTFASILGISQSHLSSLEAGISSPSETLLLLVCKEFDVNMSWLTDGQGPMTEPGKALSTQELKEIEELVQGIEFDAVAKYAEMFLMNHRMMARALVKALNKGKKLNPELCSFFLVGLLEEVLGLREEEPFISVQKMLQKWKPHASAGKESSSDQP